MKLNDGTIMLSKKKDVPKQTTGQGCWSAVLSDMLNHFGVDLSQRTVPNVAYHHMALNVFGTESKSVFNESAQYGQYQIMIDWMEDLSFEKEMEISKEASLDEIEEYTM